MPAWEPTTGATGVIVLRRPRWGTSDWTRSYGVLVDGTRVGMLGPGKTCRVEVRAGSHDVRCALDRITSTPLTVDVEANRVARVLCKPGSKPFRGLRVVGASPEPAPWVCLELEG